MGANEGAKAPGKGEEKGKGKGKGGFGAGLLRFSIFVSTMVVLFGCMAIAMLGGPEKASDALNYRAMRFFRDLGRVKARRRLYAGANAVQVYSDVLMGRETDTLELAETDEVVTFEELAQFDGLTDPNAPLWLAVRGRVYDVSKGTSFYAPGKNYHAFVGKDATRAFCTGCLEPACLISSTLGLSDAQVKEADRWAEYYEHHDKYTFIGKLEKPRVDIDELVEEALFAEEDGDYVPPAVPSDSPDLR